MKPLKNMFSPVYFILKIALLFACPVISYSQPRLVISSGHVSFVNTAEFSPDGKWFVTASDDQIAKIWEVVSGRVVNSLEGHNSYVLTARFSPDGKMVITGSLDNTCKIWETVSGKMLHSLEGHTGNIYSVQFNRDGAYVLTTSGDNTAKIWEIASQKLLKSIKLIGWTQIAFSPDSRWKSDYNIFCR